MGNYRKYLLVLFFALISIIALSACKSTTPTQLATPSDLMIEGAELTWSSVPNASEYKVNIDGIEYTAPTTSFSLSIVTAVKSYEVMVKAIGDGTNYVDSEWSRAEEYIINKPIITVAQPTYVGNALTYGDDLPTITTVTTGGTVTLNKGQTLTAGTKSYNWTFTPNDTDNFIWTNTTGTISLTVAKKAMSVTQPTYDGSTLTYGNDLPTITTKTTGGIITLDAQQTLIVGTNDYAWTFTPADIDNYEWSNTTGMISLSVYKAALSIAQPTYTGEALSYGDSLPTIETITTGGVITLDATQILLVGTHEYSWTFMPIDNDNYEIAKGKISLTVEKRAVTVAQPTFSGALTYGDDLPTITTTTAGGTIVLDANQTLTAGAKAYNWTFTPDDTDNYEWGNTKGTISLAVNKAQIEKPALTEATFIYDATTKTVSLNTVGAFTLGDITNATNANSYIATVTLNDTENYEWTDGTIAVLNLPWTIRKATISVAQPTFNGTLIYGNNLPTITTTTAGGAIVLDANQTLTAGTKNYNWTFIPADIDNYEWSNLIGTISLTVNKAQIAKPILVTASFIFDTTERILSLSESGAFTLGGVMSATNAGNYMAIVTLNDTANYEWIDGTTELLNLSWSISKAKVTVAEPTFSETLTYGDNLPTITTTTAGGTIALNSGQTLTAGIKAYNWTFTPDDTDNYEWSNTTNTIYLHVNKAILTVAQPAYLGDTLAYGDELPIITSTTTSGTIALVCGQILTVGKNKYDWEFTPFDEENYERVFGTIELEVKKGIRNLFEDFILSVALTTLTSVRLSSNYDIVVTECSVDGIIWQRERIFSNLIANKTYTFYMRLPETENYFASESVYVEKNISATDEEIFLHSNETITSLSDLGKTAQSLNIPSTLNGITITKIGASAFSGLTSLKEIVIPETITEIGHSAFEATGITAVTIPKSVVQIGYSAFSGCTYLAKITIPQNVTAIGNYAFSGCTALLEVNYNATDCADLTMGIFSSAGTKAIGITVTIGANVKTIPSYIFAGAVNISSLVFASESQCEEIRAYAFSGCSGLESIVLPDSLKIIGDSAFISCNGLTSLIIPKNVVAIGRMTLYGCSKIASLTIPFVGNTLNASTNTHFGYIFGASSYTSHNNTNYVPIFLRTVIVTGGNKFDSNAFNGCFFITSITIPKTVATMGENVFNGVSPNLSITWNYNPSLNASTFSNYLKSLTIPEGITSIADSAFLNCSSLIEVTIPSSITSIGIGAFSGCAGLAVVNYNATNCANLTSSAFVGAGASNTGIQLTISANVAKIPNFLFRSAKIAEIIFAGDSVCDSIGEASFSACGIAKICLPDNLKSIGASAFEGCLITSLIIPATVTDIGNKAFLSSYLGSFLESIVVESENTIYKSDENCLIEIGSNTLLLGCNNSTIPNYIEAIAAYAFYGCANLSMSLLISDKVTSIGAYAFYNCRALIGVRLGSNLIEIGTYAFYGCSGLNGSLTIPKGVTAIEPYAFYGCSSLSFLSLHAKVTDIKEYAFYGCSNIEVDMGECYYDSEIFTWRIEYSNLKRIGNSAFYGCSSLSQIVIPASVTTIDSEAFYNCNSLVKVFYGGASQGSWNSITNGSYIGQIASATRYYYSTSYNDDGQHWHYVNNSPTLYY